MRNALDKAALAKLSFEGLSFESSGTDFLVDLIEQFEELKDPFLEFIEQSPKSLRSMY